MATVRRIDCPKASNTSFGPPGGGLTTTVPPFDELIFIGDERGLRMRGYDKLPDRWKVAELERAISRARDSVASNVRHGSVKRRYPTSVRGGVLRAVLRTNRDQSGQPSADRLQQPPRRLDKSLSPSPFLSPAAKGEELKGEL
jgi:hypothetical protein